MKKLISLLLVFVMLMTFIPAGVFAGEAAYYVAGTASLCESNWNCSDPGNKMTLNEETGLYEKLYHSVGAGSHEFKVTDGTWDNSWGDNGSNYAFTTTEVQDVTITFNADSKEITVSLSEATEKPVDESVAYYVAGTGALCGAEWDPGYEGAKMTHKGNGIYEKLFENVAAGSHEFKITAGDWTRNWGANGTPDGQNIKFTTEKEQHVLITFDSNTKAISYEILETVAYYVAGSDGLCGVGWDPGYAGNRMDLTSNGLYVKYFINVPAGHHEFKVTDGTWTNSWGVDGGNYTFDTEDDCNVIITFNAETTEITVELIDVADYYVAGSDGLCGVGWNPGYADNKMYLDVDGLYKKLFKSVPAGTHECKVTDGTWNNSWGAEGGANFSFETDDVYNVTITFNAETKELGYVLSEATAPDPVEPVEYDITINLHYYRPDGNYADWEVHMWNGVESLSSTRKFADELVEYDGKQWAVTTYYADASDTWVGFIIKTPAWTKDPDGDRHIDISDVTGGTVNVYAVSGSALEDFETDKSQATLGAKLTAAVYDYKTSTITATVSYPLEDVTVDTFTLEGPDGQMTISAIEVIDEYNYKLTYEGVIDEMNVYTLYFGDVPCVVTIPNTYSTSDFEAEYTYTGDDLGATWTAEATTFRLWAPTAAAVSVNLYDAGNDGSKLDTVEMTADVNGTWVATVEGDLNGVYYTYSVTRKGETVEAVDPYARTTGVNGNRAMVVDLDSTDPEGWENDTYVTQENYTDAVIWELHVRDFSIDESSGVSEANRGKFLAFTETGTTVNGEGEISTGIDYMVDLGVNYVHLLPVYDINSVDETIGGYNWGYDPKNYNVPEGSYSTDPYNGAVRVTEFKQMVQSLHEQGIGVIMDVVYNHVADAGQFCFNQIVPGYFSRVHDDGSYQSNSGCGNDTASERSMVSKYIVDSVLYWCEEYHIDGFRWDLVGLIDYETINAVMEAVHEVNPDIIFYGEGWEMCSWTTKDEGEYASDPYTNKMTIQNNDKMVNTEAGTFAFFNDTIRNVIHGGVFTATDKGFVCGLNDGNRQTVIDGYMAYSVWGSAGERVDTPIQTINYASCHDNYTLFDNFTVDALDLNGLALSAENADAVAVQAYEYNKMAAAYYITAQGVPFIHAGEEMLRSKPTEDAEGNFVFDHNSYSSGDGVNSFKWAMLQDDMVDASYDYYKGLIAFRKAHPALRMTDQTEILAAMESLETGSSDVIAILNKGGNGENNQILTVINASADSYTMTLPEGKWDIYVDYAVAGTEVLQTVEGTVDVSSTSVMILVQEGPTFVDVPVDSFYSEAVEWAVEEGITTGKDDGLFHPTDEVSRAEVVTFLWRAAGEPVVEAENPFVDVAETDFYYNAVLWAVEQGITTGKDATHFAPLDKCNRAEAVTFLYRSAGSPDLGFGGGEEFTDVEVPSFYATAVMWAMNKGITNGMGDGTFGVNVICNRAHIVTFLYRLAN